MKTKGDMDQPDPTEKTKRFRWLSRVDSQFSHGQKTTSCYRWTSVRGIPRATGLSTGIHTFSDINRHTSLFKQISSIEDCNFLKKDLDKIYEWSMANNVFQLM